jgi:hypothetical protein
MTREEYVIESFRRLPEAVRRDIMDRLAVEVMDAHRRLEGETEARREMWTFADCRALVEPSDEREPANHPYRHARTR